MFERHDACERDTGGADDNARGGEGRAGQAVGAPAEHDRSGAGEGSGKGVALAVELERRSGVLRPRLAASELGTTFIKLGQTLSTRPDLIPKGLATELSPVGQAAALLAMVARFSAFAKAMIALNIGTSVPAAASEPMKDRSIFKMSTGR